MKLHKTFAVGFVTMGLLLAAAGAVISPGADSLAVASPLDRPQPKPATTPLLSFVQGSQNRLQVTEVLRIMMRFPQVEAELQVPSIRTTVYSFTERIDSVLADGSANIGITLDSFQTKIAIGEGSGAEKFFAFNSADEFDLRHNLRDIRALPRAQLLGHTLHYTLSPRGLVKNFSNLKDFYKEAVGKGYDYDFVHALIAMADSLRLGQLFEPAFGGLAALGAEAPLLTNYTMTEIPVDRTISSRVKDDTIFVNARYDNAPPRIDYLEGIAFPLGIQHFEGTGRGFAVVKNGVSSFGTFTDTASFALNVDIETVPEEIRRTITYQRTAIPVLRGIQVQLRTIEEHKAKWDPEAAAKKLREEKERRRAE